MLPVTAVKSKQPMLHAVFLVAAEGVSCLSAVTSTRLIPARSKMIIAISDMLRSEGVLYTMPPMSRPSGPTQDTSVDDGGGGDAVCLVLSSLHSVLTSRFSKFRTQVSVLTQNSELSVEGGQCSQLRHQ